MALLVVVSCAAPPAPEPVPEVVEGPPVVEPVAEEPIGTVRVTATTLRVRSGPSTSDAVVAEVRKGTKLALLEEQKTWSRVRLANGTTGWVSASFVRREKNCMPDRDFRFITPPVPFVPETSAHGIVVVEATVETNGRISATRIVSNTTGDAALGESTVREIRGAAFDPPIRDCKHKRFIYAYRRTF